MIKMMITMMISIIVLLMINMIVLCIYAISLFSSHITCFQTWTCLLCDSVFWYKNTYECHKKICCGKGAYHCNECDKVYTTKKALCAHRKKNHTDDVCFVVLLYSV